MEWCQWVWCEHACARNTLTSGRCAFYKRKCPRVLRKREIIEWPQFENQTNLDKGMCWFLCLEACQTTVFRWFLTSQKLCLGSFLTTRDQWGRLTYVEAGLGININLDESDKENYPDWWVKVRKKRKEENKNLNKELTRDRQLWIMTKWYCPA